MFTTIKKAITQYLLFEKAITDLQLVTLKKLSKADVYKLACVAAFYGYSVEDYDVIFNVKKAD